MVNPTPCLGRLDPRALRVSLAPQKAFPAKSISSLGLRGGGGGVPYLFGCWGRLGKRPKCWIFNFLHYKLPKNLHEVFVLRLGKVSIGEGMDFSQSKMQVYLILATMCSDTEPSCVLDLDIIITSLAHHNCVAHPSQLCRVVLKVDQAIGVGYLLEADRATGSTFQWAYISCVHCTSVSKSHPVIQRQIIISLSIISTHLNSFSTFQPVLIQVHLFKRVLWLGKIFSIKYSDTFSVPVPRWGHKKYFILTEKVTWNFHVPMRCRTDNNLATILIKCHFATEWDQETCAWCYKTFYGRNLQP